MSMARYFYTIETPHNQPHGPQMHVTNEAGVYIGSLEEAAALAMSHRQGSWGTSYFIRTQYGVMYETQEIADDQE